MQKAGNIIKRYPVVIIFMRSKGNPEVIVTPIRPAEKGINAIRSVIALGMLGLRFLR